MKDMSAQIRTADFATAKQMLDGWTKDRDAARVALALGHPSLIIRRQAADALGHIGDRAAVPGLIEALERNQVVYGGGSEEKVLQSELNAALIAGLSKLTGTDFGAPDPATGQDIRRVLEASREWRQKNETKETGPA